MPAIVSATEQVDSSGEEPREPSSTRDAERSHGVALQVAYEGTAFHGWAWQPGLRTACGELLQAVQQIRPEVRLLRAASRTDAGVHARGQLVAFDCGKELAPRGWVLALNAKLPSDLAVRAAWPAAVGFTPRFMAKGKRYRYRLLQDPVRDPLGERDAWRLAEPLQLALMREATTLLQGAHDFRAFRGAADVREDTRRHLWRVELLEDSIDPRRLDLVVEGDRFLYNMVRILAGTLVDIGRRRRTSAHVEEALRGGSRAILGITAPAHGLTLEEVFLADPLAGKWPS